MLKSISISEGKPFLPSCSLVGEETKLNVMLNCTLQYAFTSNYFVGNMKLHPTTRDEA